MGIFGEPDSDERDFAIRIFFYSAVLIVIILGVIQLILAPPEDSSDDLSPPPSISEDFSEPNFDRIPESDGFSGGFR